MTWTRVAAAADVVAGRPYGLSTGGVELVLVRTTGGLRAYEGRCPHQGALLAEGELDRGVLVCRNHGWRFEATTGRRQGGPECLRECPVREAGGDVMVDAGALGPVEARHRGRAVRAGDLRALADLPGPRGLPLVGNVFQMEHARLHTLLEGWATAHGPLYQLRFGARRVLVVADRDAGDYALRARPDTFRRIRSFEAVSTELGMMGVFSAEGEAWRPLRRLAMDALANRHMRGFYPALERVTRRLTGRWESAAASGQILEVTDELKNVSVDVTTWLALGRDVNTVEGQSDVIEESAALIFPTIHRRAIAIVPYWRLFRLPADRRFDRAVAQVRAWVDEVITDARARLASAPTGALAPANFLEAMLCEHDENGHPFSSDVLFGSAITMLVAGQETISTTLAWTVHHLCRHPQALVRLRAELDAVLGDDAVPRDVDQVQRLHYTGAVISEAMRLNPVAPILYLEANEDCVLGDVAVPRGTAVFVLTRPSVRSGRFGDPTAFRPERWLDDERGHLAHDPTAHIPFGSGPRLCPGRPLATVVTRVVLASLFKSFDIEPVGEEVTEVFTSIMSPSRVAVRLRARNAADDRAIRRISGE